jgi:hypothetical protein
LEECGREEEAFEEGQGSCRAVGQMMMKLTGYEDEGGNFLEVSDVYSR